jgi:hypothetical protein
LLEKKEAIRGGILDVVKMLMKQEGVQISFINKLNIVHPRHTGEEGVAQLRGQVLLIETGTHEATELLNNHDFSDHL